MGNFTPLTSIVFSIWVKMWGKYPTGSGDGARWYSFTDEKSSSEPPPMVVFATSNYTVGGANAPCGVGHEFSFNDGDVSFVKFHDPYPANYRILKQVSDSQFNFTLYCRTDTGNTGAGNLIYRYCGKDCCLILWPYGMFGNFMSFYLKGGKVGADGKVDPDNHGQFYYCGQGMVPSASGNIFYKDFEEVDANTLKYTGLNIDSLQNDEVIFLKDSNLSMQVDPHESFDWHSNCSVEDLPSDGDSENLDCDFCISKITDCCNDNAFTSDLNEFSSIVTPEPYINSENGEEERTTYNANVHIAKVLRQSFKTFYALFSKISCQLDATLKANKVEKESLDKIVKALENMDNHPEIIVSPSENVFVSRVRYNVDSDY